ncbi:hypothetical protein [Kosakonia sacchari]|uniref:hypothetical protein n=1 Tax=Kosakonia sacchari TaxID=1158459 RepID=UPI001584BCA8|nr:hypothetical protein [Kosakonia sacchari]
MIKIMIATAVWLLVFGVSAQFIEQPLVNRLALFNDVVIILVAIALHCSLKHKREEKVEWKNGMPVDERPDEKLTDISTAMYLWQQSGIMNTYMMLENLSKALNRAGYDMTRELIHGHFLPDIGYMLPHLRKQVAADLVRAKELHWAPEQSPEVLDDVVRLSEKSGFGEKMLEDLLDNLGKRGWRLRQLRTDRELYAYPLQQIVVKVTGKYDARKGDFIQCLEHLATTLATEMKVPPTNNVFPDEHGRYSGPDMATEVRYSVTRMACDYPPGFFPEPCPLSPPPALTGMMKEFNASLENHIVVILQRTRTASPDMLPVMLKKVTRQLEDGLTLGVDEDDDTGYAFCCQGSCFD